VVVLVGMVVVVVAWVVVVYHLACVSGLTYSLVLKKLWVEW
jgi:hypothetical protein